MQKWPFYERRCDALASPQPPPQQRIIAAKNLLIWVNKEWQKEKKTKLAHSQYYNLKRKKKNSYINRIVVLRNDYDSQQWWYPKEFCDVDPWGLHQDIECSSHMEMRQDCPALGTFGLIRWWDPLLTTLLALVAFSLLLLLLFLRQWWPSRSQHRSQALKTNGHQGKTEVKVGKIRAIRCCHCSLQLGS